MAFYSFRIGEDTREYYRYDDAARMLSISMKTMRHRVKIGAIPSFSIKGRTYIPAAFVQRTMRQGWEV